MARTRAPKRQEAVIKKSVLAAEIVRIIRDRGLTQTEAAYVVRDAPSQLSLIINGHLVGFSAERLIRLLARFGRDVEIVVRRAKRGAGKVRIVVR
ncbi:MAG: helix-turn-helix domain-containing protein [Gemmatimonadaceae bacterium]